MDSLEVLDGINSFCAHSRAVTLSNEAGNSATIDLIKGSRLKDYRFISQCTNCLPALPHNQFSSYCNQNNCYLLKHPPPHY